MNTWDLVQICLSGPEFCAAECRWLLDGLDLLTMQEWKMQEAAKEHKARQKNQEFRQLLEQQIKDNATLRTKQPMSEVEKKINANLLKQLQESGIKVAAT